MPTLRYFAPAEAPARMLQLLARQCFPNERLTGSLLSATVPGSFDAALLSPEGQLLAFTTAEWRKSGCTMELCNVATLPAHRRQGHATTVLSAVIARCRARGGVRAIHVWTWLSNQAAVSLYERVGFSKTRKGRKRGRRVQYLRLKLVN